MKQTKPIYKTQENCRLWDSEEDIAKISKFGTPLEKLSKVIDFDMFRETLRKAC